MRNIVVLLIVAALGMLLVSSASAAPTASFKIIITMQYLDFSLTSAATYSTMEWTVPDAQPVGGSVDDQIANASTNMGVGDLVLQNLGGAPLQVTMTAIDLASPVTYHDDETDADLTTLWIETQAGADPDMFYLEYYHNALGPHPHLGASTPGHPTDPVTEPLWANGGVTYVLPVKSVAGADVEHVWIKLKTPSASFPSTAVTHNITITFLAAAHS